MTSKDVHGPIPRTWDSITLHGTRDCVGEIMVKNLELGGLSWIISWAQYYHKGP